MTSRERVLAALKGDGPDRAPRQLWTLPWAADHYPRELADIAAEFPDDIVNVPCALTEPSPVERGNPYEIGTYVDPFGCVFTNRQRGVIGEVKDPIVRGEEWEDWQNARLPEEWLSFSVVEVNERIRRDYADKFTLSGHCPRPFEQLQFIRGTENLYIDLLTQPAKFLEWKERLHDFYCRLLKKWAQTDVDGLMMMDDWGSQRALLIRPELWDELFRPMYRDYIDIAHAAGKKIFMHSDGYTLDIIPRLIDLGLDAFNTQLFCMGVGQLAPFRGKITFWGEIDRQQILPYGTPAEVRAAVKEVYETLYDGGHCIAQCEFGAGARPENVRAVFAAWDELSGRN